MGKAFLHPDTIAAQVITVISAATLGHLYQRQAISQGSHKQVLGK